MRDELAAILTESLAALGFRRRGGNWYRAGPTLYSIVNLQASRWDESVYLNIGFAPADRVPNGWLPESKCMVRFRIEALKRVSMEDLRLLKEDAFSAMGQDTWREAVAKGLVDPVVRLLERATDTSGLRHVLQTELTERAMIHSEMRSALGLP